MSWGADDVLGFVVVIAVVVIPSLALTARFALRPIVESMLRIRESLDRERTPANDARLSALESRVADMQDTLERVAAAIEFDARLRAETPAPAVSAPPAAGPRLVRRTAQPAAFPPPPPSSPPGDPSDYEQEYL